MPPHTRAMIAAAAHAFITGNKVAGVYDHSTGRHLRIAAEARGQQLQGYDGDRAARFGGTLPEIYDATVVQPIRIVSEEGLWQVVDVKLIDAAVNGVGQTVAGASEQVRRLQTGSVRAYAASVFLGVVAILGYYLWR